MDLTQKYIKMCEKAGEIQKKAPHIDSAFYFSNFCAYKIIPEIKHNFIENINEYYVTTYGFFIENRKFRETMIWLPRQDQLQEMIEGHWLKFPLLAKYFWFTPDSKENTLKKFHSMEQIWLAYIMRDKYNKTWDGEEWISR